MINKSLHFPYRAEKNPVIESYLFTQYSKQKLKCLSDTYQELAKLYIDEQIRNNSMGHRQDYFYSMQMNEAKQIFSRHLEEISGAVLDVADTMIQVNFPTEHKRRALIKYLHKHGIAVKDIMFLDGGGYEGNIIEDNGKLSYFDNRISICARLIHGYILSVDELAGLLSDFFERRLVASLEGARTITKFYDTFVFEDEPQYTMVSAVSRAAKEGEKISGDNFSIEEYNQNKIIMMIADGMGSGEQACSDSQAVIEFMERFLEVGFDKEKALAMVNNAFVSKNNCCNLTTLDICSINMLTGEAEFIKAGAAQSYIKRESEVLEIFSGSLPIGSFCELGALTTGIKLKNHDMVIMLSDGVVDAIESEEVLLKDIISKCQYDNPREISNYLLEYAINCGKGHIQDDMTILVAKILQVN